LTSEEEDQIREKSSIKSQLTKLKRQLKSTGGQKTVARVKQRKPNTKETQQKPSAKVKLKSSETIFNRIKWDKSLDEKEFTIVYEDRVLGDQEKEYTDWSKDIHEVDSIPFHRILQFKRNGIVVWDRKARFSSLN